MGKSSGADVLDRSSTKTAINLPECKWNSSPLPGMTTSLTLTNRSTADRAMPSRLQPTHSSWPLTDLSPVSSNSGASWEGGHIQVSAKS